MNEQPMDTEVTKSHSDSNVTKAETVRNAITIQTSSGKTLAEVLLSIVRTDGAIALLAAAGFLLYWQIVLRVHISTVPMLCLATIFALLLSLLLTVAAARSMRSLHVLIISLALSALFTLPSVLPMIYGGRFPAGLLSGLRAYFHLLALLPGSRGLLLIWFAACVGVGVSRLIREMKLLLPISVVLAIVDLYVVFGGGLVAQANSGKVVVAQRAMTALTAPLTPKIVLSGGLQIPQFAVGFADFLFIALFFACFVRFGVPSRRTFYVLSGLLAAYMGVVILFGVDLPALVPIAVVVIGMNINQFRYERSEAFALLVVGLLVAGIIGALMFFSRH